MNKKFKRETLPAIVFNKLVEYDINLSNKQKNILRNTLAWYETTRNGEFLTYINDCVLPSKGEIISLFNYIDKGIEGVKEKYPDIFTAWCCHYTNPIKAVIDYENGDSKNPPISPPSAWFYNRTHNSYFEGWIPLMEECWLSCIKDIYKNWEFRKPTKQEIIDKWERGLPIYQKIERYYRIFSLEQNIPLQGNY